MVPLLMVLILCISLLSSAQAGSIYVCPGPDGGTLVRSLPESPSCAAHIGHIARSNSTVARQVLRLASPSIHPKVNATICSCIETTVRVLKDLTGKYKYVNQSTVQIPVTELACLRMSQWQMSEFGPMHWAGNGFATNHSVEWSLPWGPFGCCRWHVYKVTNCYQAYTEVSATTVRPLTSVDFAVPETCHLTTGKCSVPNGPYVMWKPPPQESRCSNVTHSIPGYSLQTSQGFYWVSSNGTHFLEHSNPTAVLLCGKQYETTQVTSLMQPLNFQRDSVGASDITAGKFALMFLSACSQEVDRVRNLWQNVPKYYSARSPSVDLPKHLSIQQYEGVAAVQFCHTLPITSNVVAATSGESGHAWKPVVFNVSGVEYRGYLDELRNAIFQSRVAVTDVVPATLVKAADLRNYLPELLGSDITASETEVSPMDLIGWQRQPPRGYQVVDDVHTSWEVEHFMAQLFPLWANQPFGIQHAWVLGLCVYMTCAIVVLHCFPCLNYVCYLNPCYAIYRSSCGQNAAQRLRGSKRRNRSPRFRRRLNECHQLLSNLTAEPQRQASRSGRRTPVSLPPPGGAPPSAPRIRVLQVHAYNSKTGSLKATVEIRIRRKKFIALFDTGSDICLLDAEIAQKLGYTPEPPDLQATSISNHVFGLSGRIWPKVHLGQRSIDGHPFYLASGMPYAALLGFDLLPRLGPILLDVQEGQLHLYTRCPRSAANVVPFGQYQDWAESAVSIEETMVIPPRVQVLLPGRCPTAPNNADQVFQPSEKLCRQKGVSVAHVLAKPKQGVIPVRLLNPYTEPIKLYKNTTLGHLQSLDQPVLVNMVNVEPSKKKIPPKVNPLGEVDLSQSVLSHRERERFREFLHGYTDIFASSNLDLGCLKSDIEHTINVGTHAPIKQRPYRTEISRRSEIDKQISDMVDAGVVRPSQSPWASPVVLVPKKDGSVRFCVDYRRLNQITEKDVFPLPLISEVLDSLGTAKYFSSLDMASGYWQVRVADKDIPKTAFVTYNGLWEFTRVPFGLSNAPALFQRTMQTVLAGLQPQIALIYLDDILVHSATFEKHLKDLESVFQHFREYNLKLKPSKCHFAQRQVGYLGHVITAEGLRPDPSKVHAVNEYPTPVDVTSVRRFLGLVGYYRRFIPHFATIARPLFRLLKKHIPFEWAADCQVAQETLQKALTSAPVLRYPDFTKPFVLETDASGIGLGCVLLQEGPNSFLHPVAYASRTLQKHEGNYTVTEQECLAVHYGLKMFRTYVLGHQCTVITDHEALRWLMTQQNPSGRLARWALALQEYDLKIEYRSGRKNEKADALSRAPVPCVAALDSLPAPKSIIQCQKDDPTLGPLYTFLASGKLPTEPAAASSVERLSKDVQLSDMGTLVLRRPHTRRQAFQPHRIMVPAALQRTLLQAYHENPLSGHLGVRKVLDKLRLKYYWPGMETQVKDYIKGCDPCQRHKDPVPRAKPALQPIAPVAPFHTIGMDIMELPMSYDGNRYLLVLMDYLTKWVEAFPMPDQKADRIAAIIVTQFICRYGAPSRILSDAAPNFLSAVVLSICRLCNIQKVTTTPYAPQTDGLVERANRTLQGIMRMYVESSQRNWDELLPFALFSLRASVQDTTGESPYFLLFGQDPLMPQDVAFNYQQSPYVASEDLPYSEQVQLRLTKAWQLARQRAASQQQRQADNHDRNATFPMYQVDDLVLLRALPVPGRAKKLGPRWRGPYRIVELHANNNAHIQVMDRSHDPFRVHLRRLKRYKEAAVKVDPAVIDHNLESEAGDG